MTEQQITAQPSEPRQRPKNRTTWLIPAGLIVLSLVPMIAGAMRLTALTEGAEITESNARFFASPIPAIAHIVAATVSAVLGAFQFVPRLRRGRAGRRSWHRGAGRILVVAGLIAGISGMWMAVFYTRPELDMVVRLFFGAVMVTSIVLGLGAIVRRDFARHRAWMIRGCAVGMGAGTQVLTPVPFVWRDWVLDAVVPMLIVFESVLRPDLPNLVAAAVITAAGVATLMGRRAWPPLMFVIGFGSASVFALVTGHEVQLYSSAYLLLLVYAVFRWGSGRAMLVGGAIMVASTLTSTLRGPFEVADLVGNLLFLLVTISLGLLMRLRVGWQLRDIDRAKSREREELARDLHDTVAHHVSAIAIQAQAGLATVGSNPDAATAALRVIEAEASQTLTEMRSMVRVLRRDDAVELAPSQTVADLHALAGNDRGGPALDVQLAGPFDELPAPVASAVFRIVQESVTNARRHARTAGRSPDGCWIVAVDLPCTGAVA